MSRLETLLRSMTLEERIGQLTMLSAGFAITGPVLAENATAAVRAGRVGGLINLWGPKEVQAIQRVAVEETRLGIPLILGFDVLHGQRTVFPIPLAEAATFDPDLWEASARMAAAEAAADGISLVFAPMLDVARDPRWGRIAESPGEDPWVAARFAEAKVRGFQGGGLSAAESVAATAKHFCAYGAVTGGRDYAPVDVSERTLHEVHLPPFRAAIGAGVAAVMPAFTDLAGIPMTAHVPLMRGWLREQAGFEGVVVSDYHAITELIAHGVAADPTEAAALALKAGVDIDLVGGAYERGLAAALDRGLVELPEIDAAVLRVLALKERLGLFDDPYRRGAGAGAAVTEESRQLARDAARRAIVMLKNAGKVLPFGEEVGRLAVLGPLADAPGAMLGPWAGAGRSDDAVSIVDGLRTALPASEVVSAAGVTFDGEDFDSNGALDLCRSADAVVLCLGEAATMSGEAASRADLGLPGHQRDLAEAALGLGKPVVAVLSSGRPLTIPWLVERADAVLASWFLGVEAGHAIADVLTGRFNPTGRLPITWPRAVGQVPIFYGARPSGRPFNAGDHYTSKYIDLSNEPLFPFGHGLSYADFELSDLVADPAEFRTGDRIEISVRVSNRGARAGEATVFLFVRDLVASVAQPLLELKAVAKIALEPGETGIVRRTLEAADLALLGPDLTPVLEPGEFEILAGQSADRAMLLSTTVRLLAA
jgi:beta-glucosidase